MPERVRCVQCGQPIPGVSKVADQVLPLQEAKKNNWSGIANQDGTVTVKMCLQCQVDRSARLKNARRSAPSN